MKGKTIYLNKKEQEVILWLLDDYLNRAASDDPNQDEIDKNVQKLIDKLKR